MTTPPIPAPAFRLKTKISGHQLTILRIIVAGNDTQDPDEKNADPDQVIDKFGREKVSKESLQFTVRSLIQHGLIEKTPTVKRRGRKRVTYVATVFGALIGKVVTPVPQGFIEPEGEDLGEILLSAGL